MLNRQPPFLRGRMGHDAAHYISERNISAAHARYLTPPDGEEREPETPGYIVARLTELEEQLVELLAQNTGITIHVNLHCADAVWLKDYLTFGGELSAAVGRLGRVVEKAKQI